MNVYNKKIIINITLFLFGLLFLNIGFIYVKKDSEKLLKKNKYIDELLNNNTLESYNNELDELKTKLESYEYDNKEISTILSNIDNLQEKVTNLEIEISENDEKLKTLKTENSNLTKTYNKLTSFKIEKVKTINQYPKYPTGCEAVALTILLNYYNIPVSVDDVIATMPKGETPNNIDGIYYGGNPNYEFLGSPYNNSGWGIWNKGLATTANKFKTGIIDGTGTNLSDILLIVKQNRPVIVWTSINMTTPYIAKSWIDINTREKITWKANNHAVVIIGYTENEIVVSDPINGQIRTFNRKNFEVIYNYMGKKAIYY